MVDNCCINGTFAAHQHIMTCYGFYHFEASGIDFPNCAVDYEGCTSILSTPPVMRILVAKWARSIDGRWRAVIGDAVEGPCRQRFVTKKALALGLRPIVVINKIDRCFAA